MNEPTPPRWISLLAIILNSHALLWCLLLLTGPVASKLCYLIAGYLLLSVISVAFTLKIENSRISKNRLFAFICTLSMFATLLFYGELLYSIKLPSFKYVESGFFLSAAVSTICALDQKKYFRFPIWLLVVTFIVIAGWLLVHACPTNFWALYQTGMTQMKLPTETRIILNRQHEILANRMLFAYAIALLVTIIAGRVLHARAYANNHRDTARTSCSRLYSEANAKDFSRINLFRFTFVFMGMAYLVRFIFVSDMVAGLTGCGFFLTGLGCYINGDLTLAKRRAPDSIAISAGLTLLLLSIILFWTIILTRYFYP